MEPVNPEQKEEIKGALQEEMVKTHESIEAFKEMTQPVLPENAIGRISRMDAIQNKSVVEAALRKAEEKMEALMQMAKRLDDADFGLCVRCKQDIPIRRLILMPQSAHCVQCAS